jgi:hypothetical protein
MSEEEKEKLKQEMEVKAGIHALRLAAIEWLIDWVGRQRGRRYSVEHTEYGRWRCILSPGIRSPLDNLIGPLILGKGTTDVEAIMAAKARWIELRNA